MSRYFCCACIRGRRTQGKDGEDLSPADLDELVLNPKVIDQSLEQTLADFQIAINDFERCLENYLEEYGRGNMSFIEDLKQYPLKYYNGDHNNEDIHILAEKRITVLKYEKMLSKGKNTFSVRLVRSSKDSANESDGGYWNKDRPMSNKSQKSVGEPQNNTADRHLSKNPNELAIIDMLSSIWANRLNHIDATQGQLVVPNVDRSASGMSNTSIRLKPRWPDFLTDVCFDVIKVNKYSQRLRRILKFTQHHIISIKNGKDVTKFYSYLDIKRIWLENETTICVIQRNEKRNVYISPIAPHIIQQISTRVQVRLSLDRDMYQVGGGSHDEGADSTSSYVNVLIPTIQGYTVDATAEIIKSISEENAAATEQVIMDFARELKRRTVQSIRMKKPSSSTDTSIDNNDNEEENEGEGEEKFISSETPTPHLSTRSNVSTATKQAIPFSPTNQKSSNKQSLQLHPNSLYGEENDEDRYSEVSNPLSTAPSMDETMMSGSSSPIPPPRPLGLRTASSLPTTPTPTPLRGNSSDKHHSHRTTSAGTAAETVEREDVITTAKLSLLNITTTSTMEYAGNVNGNDNEEEDGDATYNPLNTTTTATSSVMNMPMLSTPSSIHRHSFASIQATPTTTSTAENAASEIQLTTIVANTTTSTNDNESEEVSEKMSKDEEQVVSNHVSVPKSPSDSNSHNNSHHNKELVAMDNHPLGEGKQPSEEQQKADEKSTQSTLIAPKESKKERIVSTTVTSTTSSSTNNNNTNQDNSNGNGGDKLSFSAFQEDTPEYKIQIVVQQIMFDSNTNEGNTRKLFLHKLLQDLETTIQYEQQQLLPQQQHSSMSLSSSFSASTSPSFPVINAISTITNGTFGVISTAISTTTNLVTSTATFVGGGGIGGGNTGQKVKLDETFVKIRHFIDGMHEYVVNERAFSLAMAFEQHKQQLMYQQQYQQLQQQQQLAGGLLRSSSITSTNTNSLPRTASSSIITPPAPMFTSTGSARPSSVQPMQNTATVAGSVGNAPLMKPTVNNGAVASKMSLRFFKANNLGPQLIDEKLMIFLSFIIYVVVEESLFLSVKDKLITLLRIEKQYEETEVIHKMRAFSARQQSQWGIPAEFCSPLGWKTAIFELSGLEHNLTPSMQLLVLTRTCKAIYSEFKHAVIPVLQQQFLQLHGAENIITAAGAADTTTASQQLASAIPATATTTPGKPVNISSSNSHSNRSQTHSLRMPNFCIAADDLVPIFLYILCQTHGKLKHPLQNRDLMWSLCHPDQLHGESGYYLTVYESALEYIIQEPSDRMSFLRASSMSSIPENVRISAAAMLASGGGGTPSTPATTGGDRGSDSGTPNGGNNTTMWSRSKNTISYLADYTIPSNPNTTTLRESFA